jgi:hypothetical protein
VLIEATRTIWDFTGGVGAGDRLQFATSVFASQAAVLAASSVSGGNTTITMGNGNFIVLVGVNIATLAADDFSFV